MTADYNGWNDAPEAEREAIDEYTRQEFEREALAELAELQKSALRLRKYVSGSGYGDLTDLNVRAVELEFTQLS